jgi:DNA-binding transcriptional LysR family regulator
VDLSRLQVFVAVARDKSFSRAASRLGLPKSSVSREISRLEQELGVRLLHRTTRQVGLSTAGVELLQRVGPLLDQLERAVDLPDGEREPSGLLRITATVDVGEALLSDVVARFAERYPRVRVELALTNRALDLVAEGIDLAFRLSAQPRLADSSLTARVLGPWSIEAFASPLYLSRRGTPAHPRDLSHHEWVSIRGMPMPEGVQGEPRIVADDMFFVRGALRAGAGIGLMPTWLGRADLESGTLVRVLPEMTRMSGSIWMVYPGGRELPHKVSAFRDLVLESLRGPLDAA